MPGGGGARTCATRVVTCAANVALPVSGLVPRYSVCKRVPCASYTAIVPHIASLYASPTTGMVVPSTPVAMVATGVAGAGLESYQLWAFATASCPTCSPRARS
jgi:hypothetical protein